MLLQWGAEADTDTVAGVKTEFVDIGCISPGQK